MTETAYKRHLKLAGLAVPLVGQSVLSIGPQLADIAICSRLPESTAALAAISYAVEVLALFWLPVLALTWVLVGILSQHFGSGNRESMNSAFQSSLVIAVGFAVLVAVLLIFFAPQLVRLLGAEEERSAGLAAAYVRVATIGLPFEAFSAVIVCTLRCTEKTSTALWIQLIAETVIAVPLAYCLVHGVGVPALGVMGAAAALVIGHIVSAMLLGRTVRRGIVDGLALALPTRDRWRQSARRVVSQTLPALLAVSFANLSGLVMFPVISGFGPAAVAAHGVTLRIVFVIMLIPEAIGLAQATMVGQVVGTGHHQRALSIRDHAIVQCLVASTTLVIALLLFPGFVLRLLGIPSDSSVEMYSYVLLAHLALYVPLTASWAAIGPFLMGAGLPWINAKVDFAGLLVQLAVLWLITRDPELGIVAAWLAIDTAVATRIILSILAMRSETRFASSTNDCPKSPDLQPSD